MELWNRIMGTVGLELTTADPEALLGQMAKQGIDLWDIRRVSFLCVTFRVCRGSLPEVERAAKRQGARLRTLGVHGIYYSLQQWRKRPILIAVVLLLLFASVFVPNRILFVNVVGNETVPTRLIQEKASELGLEFGTSRRGVRSERIKNELLGALEELEWVGVNTSGCVATITVRERQPQPEAENGAVCNLVSSADGIIEKVSLTRGTLLCQAGQAVQEGQLLVSGYKDLGICTRAVEAEAEIYALTRREERAILPATTLNRGAITGQTVKFSLVIGKKRINFASDSGILPTTCGKMTEEIPLRLPGGWTLPVSLIVERYTEYETCAQPREENAAAGQMAIAAEREALAGMVAGQILSAGTQTENGAGYFALSCRYQCREMIARQETALDLEGETNDDPENGERGAG